MRQTIGIIIYVMFFTSCFGFRYFPSSGISAIYLLIIAFGFIRGFRYNFVFKKPLLFFLLFIAASTVSCYFIRGQSVVGSLAIETNLLAFLLVFLLLTFKCDLYNIEKSIAFLAIYFCAIYIIQTVLYPVPVYVDIDAQNAKITEGVSARLRFIGQGIGSLGYFMFVNRYFETRKKMNILLALVCFSFIILLAFRMMIVAAVLSTFYLYSQYHKVSVFSILKFVMSLGLLFVVIYFAFPQVREYFAFTFDRFAEISTVDDSYIRFKTLDYYLNDFFVSPIEYLFGAGLPNYKEPGYASIVMNNMQNGIYWDDWGLLGLSFMIGPLTVISLIVLSVKAIRLKVDRRYRYFAAWYIFLLIISPLNTEFFRTGNPAIHALVLYCLILANRQYENRNHYIPSRR